MVHNVNHMFVLLRFECELRDIYNADESVFGLTSVHQLSVSGRKTFCNSEGYQIL
jgi:hypothetical protein